MKEQSELSKHSPTASPWPVFVALGIVLSEVGIFIGGILLPLGIGGVLLLEGSVVGIIRESGYSQQLWFTSLIVGAIAAAIGVILLVIGTPGGQFRIYRRGLALVGAGSLALLASLGFYFIENTLE